MNYIKHNGTQGVKRTQVNLTRDDARAQKHAEAIERNEAWASLSDADKVAALDARLGEKVGAAKQRKRLGGA